MYIASKLLKLSHKYEYNSLHKYPNAFNLRLNAEIYAHNYKKPTFKGLAQV